LKFKGKHPAFNMMGTMTLAIVTILIREIKYWSIETDIYQSQPTLFIKLLPASIWTLNIFYSHCEDGI
jgi:hypothetical protein